MIEHLRRESSRDGYPQQAPMRDTFAPVIERLTSAT
jgi:hypothetical protein